MCKFTNVELLRFVLLIFYLKVHSNLLFGYIEHSTPNCVPEMEGSIGVEDHVPREKINPRAF